MTGLDTPRRWPVALVIRGEGSDIRKERQVFSVEQRSGEPPSCVGTSHEETSGHRPEAFQGHMPRMDGFSTASLQSDPDLAGGLE